MKQYLSPEQTAKLIELGFEKPKNTISKQVAKRKIGYGILEWEDVGEEGSYSIGELIEMLPKVIDCDYDVYNLQIKAGSNWKICYVENGMIEDDCDSSELIDALYDMLIKLKEEKVV